MIRVLLLKDADVSLPAGHINALTCEVIVKIVGVLHTRQGGHDSITSSVLLPRAETKSRPLAVESKMIDAALNVWQRNSSGQDKWLRAQLR
jgi:hypothetical protein